ncbi:magnesium transporter CorA family protein [Alicyclobacillus cycloheptanicus]|uniref:Magnesium transporter n=1 Tax=Alicyclobacillus cycloheptanicus TaxID=1457 RepID=A0ABT9XJ73_9BACL|nr:magnesium transporter CorA family protein [Alicyclobacillus cycloheptanicus]MDQ0190360.1 magnesium transporter [Alicyclobacillus cycloheptanicus]WDM00004.1 magnesium transporter CorA family protein [Alicyclobacillus cycloheptanicus]
MKFYVYDAQAQVIRHDCRLDEIPAFIHNENFQLWIDVYNWDPADPAELKAIADVFQFHPLAIEDCIYESPRSKVDRYDRYDFFELHSLKYDEHSDHEITIEELNVFLGKNFIVTVHQHAIHSIGMIAAKSHTDPTLMSKGPEYLLYSIVDGITDTYFPIIERLSMRIDELEDEMYEHPALAITEEFLALKRTIVLIRKAIEPQRRIFANVNAPFSFTVRPEIRPYYMDLSDHLERITDSVEVFRDLVQGALDTYSSLGTAKTNETMRVLTIITTLTAMMTFITGIFGMNVPLPFQRSWWMTVVVILVMAALSVGMLYQFKKRKWI